MSYLSFSCKGDRTDIDVSDDSDDKNGDKADEECRRKRIVAKVRRNW